MSGSVASNSQPAPIGSSIRLPPKSVVPHCSQVHRSSRTRWRSASFLHTTRESIKRWPDVRLPSCSSGRQPQPGRVQARDLRYCGRTNAFGMMEGPQLTQGRQVPAHTIGLEQLRVRRPHSHCLRRRWWRMLGEPRPAAQTRRNTPPTFVRQHRRWTGRRSFVLRLTLRSAQRLGGLSSSRKPPRGRLQRGRQPWQGERMDLSVMNRPERPLPAPANPE